VNGPRSIKGPGPRAGSVQPPAGANSKSASWYHQTKATKCGGTVDRESECPIVPLNPGNRLMGPGGGKGAPNHRTVEEKDGESIGSR
jgi:hypothetical protein